eukprot:2297095-Amphidinium_carterae.1
MAHLSELHAVLQPAGHPNAVAWLLEQRAMVDTLDRTGFQTALHAAVAARPRCGLRQLLACCFVSKGETPFAAVLDFGNL